MFFINADRQTPTRYDPSKLLEFNLDNYDILTSSFVKQLRALKSAGSISVLSQEVRPDLLAYDIYGSTQYYWIVMIYNDIIAVEDIIIGTIIRYPNLNDVERIYFGLKSNQVGAQRG